NKRDLFAEIAEGMVSLADARHGKRTLRSHAVESKPTLEITPRQLIRLRKDLRLSRRGKTLCFPSQVLRERRRQRRWRAALSPHAPL
ncbi:MAG: hypothetical protein ABI609_06940, partial [Acidobacteriota bacterium]